MAMEGKVHNNDMFEQYKSDRKNRHNVSLAHLLLC